MASSLAIAGPVFELFTKRLNLVMFHEKNKRNVSQKIRGVLRWKRGARRAALYELSRKNIAHRQTSLFLTQTFTLVLVLLSQFEIVSSFLEDSIVLFDSNTQMYMVMADLPHSLPHVLVAVP